MGFGYVAPEEVSPGFCYIRVPLPIRKRLSFRPFGPIIAFFQLF